MGCSVLSPQSASNAASAVSGYLKDVDWIESCAFEMLLFRALINYRLRPAAFKYLERTVPQMVERLGWHASLLAATLLSVPVRPVAHQARVLGCGKPKKCRALGSATASWSRLPTAIYIVSPSSPAGTVRGRGRTQSASVGLTQSDAL